MEPIKIDDKAIETIRDAAIRNYRFKTSLYISVIEALQEYLIKNGTKPNFELDIKDFK